MSASRAWHAALATWSLLLPLVWLGYTLVRGALVHEYPYPFVDVDELGYARVVANCLAVTVLFGLLAAAALGLDRRLPARPVRTT